MKYYLVIILILLSFSCGNSKKTTKNSSLESTENKMVINEEVIEIVEEVTIANSIEEVAKDEEPFSLDALRRYFYLDEILDANINEQPLSTEQILQRGELPQANVGSLIFEGMEHRVDALAGQVKEQIKGGKSEPIEVALQIENTKIEGWLNHIYLQKQVKMFI